MAESLLMAGDLYVDRLTDAGVSQGLELVGNATKLEIKAESEIKEQTSKGRNTYGQVLASVAIAQPHVLNVDLNQLDKIVLAMAFLGENADISIASGSASAESVKVFHDKWVKLANREITEESVAIATFTEDTDFEVNHTAGLIKALSTGSMTDASTVSVAYDYPAQAGYRVTGATEPTIRVALFLDGKNLVNGKRGFVEIYKAQIKPSSAVDFLADDFTALSLDGTLLTPDGYTHPYKYEEYDE